MYLVTKNRPDLCVAVSILESQVLGPAKDQMNKVHHTLRYLKKAANKRQFLHPEMYDQLDADVDAS